MTERRTEKLYHIYAKGKRIYHDLSESEFNQIWDMLDKFLQVSGAMKKDDISYEEIISKKSKYSS